jgi:hypothetical protein
MCFTGHAALSEAALFALQPRSKEKIMNSHIAYALGLASSAIAAGAVVSIAATPTDAIADDITMDTQPAVSSSQVGGTFSWKGKPTERQDEWSLQQNQVAPQKTGYSRAQAQAEFKSSRNLVSTLNAEDSGSDNFKRPGELGATRVMGAPAR